jgi:hypothetical protein
MKVINSNLFLVWLFGYYLSFEIDYEIAFIEWKHFNDDRNAYLDYKLA